MRINYFSDLHLEFGEQRLPDTDADIIVAAGDIGVLGQGVEWLKALHKPVIYVAGNHEFYGGEYRRVLDQLRGECANTAIQFLEKDQFIYQGVRFLGCTLWTDLLEVEAEKLPILEKGLNDFRNIRYQERAFSPVEFSALYGESKAWLENQLARPFPGKTVVVTHHAPTEWSWPERANALRKRAYCNDLRALLHEYPITVWFHGHVHNHGDYRTADARILSNARGYVGRRLVAKFDINKTVDI
ncbi:MAG: metallophosphoesterase [Methylomonas sp.]